jgi:hypothetical protein
VSVAGDIILSIRDQIPDTAPGDDPALDGKAFSLKTLLRWVNDAGRALCARAPIIQDWGAVPSVLDQDIYVLPVGITSVEQVWYDQVPLSRSPEAANIFQEKVQGNAWWFGPHSQHATPRLFVQPAPARTALSTTLGAGLSSTATSLSLSSATGLMSFGFLRVGGTAATAEWVRYGTLSGTTALNLLRGQSGTKAATWSSGATVDEGNIFYKCYRLPSKLSVVDDPVEIPEGLWPILELYVLSKVHQAEQSHETAMGLRKEFNEAVDQLADRAAFKGLRQGIQVRLPGWETA